ncbi:MAG: beta family protein [Candidatus Paceibacterota bacterium]
MENIKSYIPILRWRPAEMSAIAKLFPKDRENITPLIEFIMPAPKTDKNDYKKILENSKDVFKKRLPEVAEQMVKYCGRDTVFVDVHLLDGDIRASMLAYILSSANSLDLFSIPVVYIIPVMSTDADMETRKIAVEYAQKNKAGLCIRIDESHFNDKNLSDYIEKFLKENKLSIENTDILVDLKIIDKNTTSDFVVEKLASIPQIEKWRSVIMSGGSFPEDLSEFEKHTHNNIERFDWKLWLDIFNNKKIKRKPIFSDYTIQHPIHRGHVVGVNTSASIRYTDEEEWKIWRGEGLRNEKGAGHQQYPAQAQLLVKQKYFKGASYSYGDEYTADRAKPENIKTGNPTTWLTAGINHHITLVSHQISNLF